MRTLPDSPAQRLSQALLRLHAFRGVQAAQTADHPRLC